MVVKNKFMKNNKSKYDRKFYHKPSTIMIEVGFIYSSINDQTINSQR